MSWVTRKLCVPWRAGHAWLDSMYEAYDHYAELRRLIDRLRPEQADAVRSVVIQLVEAPPPSLPAEEPRRRRLSFAGAIEAESDLATRSSEILRDELGGSEK
ncbi:hypothetical protein [Streptomyces sp. NPDC101115]|uniref:hypothetical protein n=1 Tax=Streptomyces sp. NPDC101115 TaxID=3366106 RepID=UPI0038240076